LTWNSPRSGALRMDATTVPALDVRPGARPQASEEDRLPVGPQHFLEGVADLVQRRIGARGIEHHRYNILAIPRGPLKLVESARDRRRIPAPPEFGKSLPLTALGRLTDGQQGNPLR